MKGAIIISFLKKEYKKKPIVTNANLNDNAAKGDASSTITFPEIKADDQSKIKKKRKKFYHLDEKYLFLIFFFPF